MAKAIEVNVITSEIKEIDIAVEQYVQTPEQLLQEWKANRQVAVDNIEVTHNEVVYQGDEVSQGRMARAVVAMDDVMTIPWVAKDNSINLLTKIELIELLSMAGVIQSALWNEGRP